MRHCFCVEGILAGCACPPAGEISHSAGVFSREPFGSSWSLGKHQLFRAVKPGQHRSLGEFCQTAYWHQGCPGAQAPLVLVEFGLGCLSIYIPLLVNSSLHGVLFCAALWSAPLYCSCLFPPTSNGDLFGCEVFPQKSLWCGVGFCENYCFSLSLIFCSAPQTEKCRWIAFQFREMWFLGLFLFYTFSVYFT